MFIQEHNCETGEITQRELTAEELTQAQADAATTATRQAEEAAKAATRKALLNKLGLTEEEARLLLGGN
jgi:hypothetical protein